MKCREAQELMGAYLYGDLEPDEMRDLRVHTQDCALCREDLATRGRIVSSLSDAVPTLSDADRQRIAWSVKGAVRRQEVRSRPLMLRLAPALGLAAAVLAAGFFAGRFATHAPQHTASAHKPVDLPKAKIEVKETTPDPNKTSNVPSEMIDVLRSLMATTTPTPEVNRASEPGSRHLPGRTSTPFASDGAVKTAPEPKARPVEHSAASGETTGAVKDSPANAKNSEVETNPGTTKLPEVTDPKNAETTPSESQ